jgi:glycosyltransferase involved in cell wall biosynthesis
MQKKKILFLVNHFSFFVSHRLPIALAAKKRGYLVEVLAGIKNQQEDLNSISVLRKNKIQVKQVSFKSMGTNPFVELVGLIQIFIHLIKFNPDIVHCASPKGVLYGGMISRLAGVKSLVIAISGMGFLFTQKDNLNFFYRFISSTYYFLFRKIFLHPNLAIIVQNKDDYNALKNNDLIQKNIVRLIPGSGVDVNLFKRKSLKKKIVLFPARLLKNKGIYEFVGAAKIIKEQIPDWQFILLGGVDPQNPDSVLMDDLRVWIRDGYVKWVGHQSNPISYYQDASIVCLPSFREGMPKSLLEAAAASCAIVTTDVIGCREAIIDGVTGDLVPVADTVRLAQALKNLILDEKKRKKYGQLGRRLSENRFNITDVINETHNIYQELLIHEK